MRKIGLLVTMSLILLFSCTPAKRLSRLIKKHPELVTSDTITRMDTTVIPLVRVDTSFKNTVSHDTIILTKDRLKIKFFNRGDTVFLSGKSEPDTIIKPVPVVVNTTAPPPEPLEWYYKFGLWFSIIFLVILIVMIIKKFV